METIISILLALLSAFLGGYFGAWFQHSFQNRKVNKVRKIAIKALDVFCRYVKQGQTFDKAASEFNNSLNVVEKRAVLVALCKLGIPVVKPINDLFQIEEVKFEHKLIDKDTLDLMKGQVNKGNCDDLFFSDVDAYFSSNTRLLAVRAVAKKYVDLDFSKCEWDKENNTLKHSKDPLQMFTLGELNILSVFRIRSCWHEYFDGNGKPILARMKELKKEIDLGLWDTYLFWDWESYQNVQSQNFMAQTFVNMMNTNMQKSTQLDNQKKSNECEDKQEK